MCWSGHLSSFLFPWQARPINFAFSTGGPSIREFLSQAFLWTPDCAFHQPRSSLQQQPPSLLRRHHFCDGSRIIPSFVKTSCSVSCLKKKKKTFLKERKTPDPISSESYHSVFALLYSKTLCSLWHHIYYSKTLTSSPHPRICLPLFPWSLKPIHLGFAHHSSDDAWIRLLQSP